MGARRRRANSEIVPTYERRSPRLAVRRALTDHGIKIQRLFCRLVALRFFPRPPVGERIIDFFGFYPTFGPRGLDLLPERSACLEVVHQELGGGERIVPMRGSGDDENNLIPRAETAEAVD